MHCFKPCVVFFPAERAYYYMNYSKKSMIMSRMTPWHIGGVLKIVGAVPPTTLYLVVVVSCINLKR